MTKHKTNTPEEESIKTLKYERLVLGYLRQLGERPYEDLCTMFDPRDTLGLDSILQGMKQVYLISIVRGSVSITDSGLKQLEHED